MDIFPKTPNFDFLGKRKMAFAVSGVAIAISLVTPIFKKPNWGVDFAGGTEIGVKFPADVDAARIREVVEKAGVGEPSVQQLGAKDEHEFLIRLGRSSLISDEEFTGTVEPKIRAALPNLGEGTKGIEYREAEGDQVTVTAKEGATLDGAVVRKAFEDAGYPVQEVRAITESRSYAVIFRGVAAKVEDALKAGLADAQPEIRSVDQVGASVGNELKLGAIKSMLLAILLILLYVGFRFDFRFAPGGVLALAHDAIIVIGYYTVTGAEVNTNTIAAVLTIIGFSINDTIVIFDRVREDMQKHKGRDLDKVINQALNETLSRTILTSLTVLLSLSGLILFTVGSLQEFAIAMLVGLVAGSWSTIYIASPLVIWLEDVMQSRKIAQGGGKSIPAKT